MSVFSRLNNLKEDDLSRVSMAERATRARQTNEWKENRERILSGIDSCQWCGREADTYHIHHTWSRQLGRKWIRASDAAFANSEAFEPWMAEARDECPECGRRDYYQRKTKTPPFRCSNCGAEFESPRTLDPNEVISRTDCDTKPYTNDGYYTAKVEWIEENRARVREEFETLLDEVIDEYVSMRDDQIVVICEACHYKEEQTPLQLCRDCRSNWHTSSNRKCWDCIVEEEGLEQCGCGDGWYDPDSYNACSECRS
jgi:ribosomal protein L37AE/L43A